MLAATATGRRRGIAGPATIRVDGRVFGRRLFLHAVRELFRFLGHVVLHCYGAWMIEDAAIIAGLTLLGVGCMAWWLIYRTRSR